MKNTLMIALACVTIAGCGKKKAGAGGGGDDKAAPTMTVNEADWVMKDMKDTSPMVHVSLKVPKDAKLEKNGNGGVDIRVSPFYVLTVSNLAVSSIDEAKKSDKSLTVENKSYQNGKIVTDEPNGFIYTYQMKDEANGTKYQPETHFVYYVDKDGAFYSIQDAKPMDAFDTPGSAYSPDIANKVYAIVKGSAKAD